LGSVESDLPTIVRAFKSHLADCHLPHDVIEAYARPAAEFVQCVMKFKSEIAICKGNEHFSAASILEVLAANLDCGARVLIEAVGPDDQEFWLRCEASRQSAALPVRTAAKTRPGLENLPRLEKMMVKQCNGSPAKQ
jgi:phosphotransferase system HPr (HPr) family protein